MKLKRVLSILCISIFFSNCMLIDFYQGYKYMASVNPEPQKIEGKRNIYSHIYGIVENEKINRMGIEKNDILKMNDIIYDKYGIRFLGNREIHAHNGGIKYYIKFYDNFKIEINGIEYILPKEEIKLVENNPYEGNIFYHFRDFKIDDAEVNDLVINIGEIEIIDRDGNIIRKRTKVPPLWFKRAYNRRIVRAWNDYGEHLYLGWLENYHEYDKTLEIEE